MNVWTKDLGSGRDTPLGTFPKDKFYPVVSPDGSKIAFGGREDQPTLSMYVVAASGFPEEVLPDACRPEHWSSDGTKLLHVRFGTNGSIGFLDTRSWQNKPYLLKHAKYQTASPRFSWDNAWITFYLVTSPTTRQIFIAPFRDEASIDQKEWIAVTDGSTLDVEPRWSPDGSIVYFLSDRDQVHECILGSSGADPVTKRPLGQAFDVFHLHRARLSARTPNAGYTGLAVIKDKIILSLEEVTGNISR